MTTSDRAGNEEPTPEQARTQRELGSRAWDVRGWCIAHREPHSLRDLMAEHAALAAAPTQTGAEGPALLALEWAMAPNDRYQGRHRTEPRCREFMPTDGTCNCGYQQAAATLAALRSGAEVAAAPGLDVEALAEAMTTIRLRFATAPGYDSMYDAALSAITELVTGPYREHIAAEYARLTAKP